jgi:hypothetical protein
MRWTFYYTPHYTSVLALTVSDPPNGSTVIVACHGRGCPFKKISKTVKKPKRCGPRAKHRCGSRTINLAPRFARRHLRVGSFITVEIIRPNWIGKHYLFRVRAGRPPRITIACLAPESTRPGVGC